MADVNANIGVNIDASDALSQLKSLQRQIAQFHSSVAKSSEAAGLAQRDLQRNFINGVNSIGSFSAELRTVKTTAESFTNSLEKNKFSMREYFRYSAASTKTFGKLFKSEFDTINKVAVQNVKQLQTQYIKMGRDASGAMKAIAIMPTQLDMTNLSTKTQIAAQRQALFNQLVKQGSTNLLNFGKNTQWAGRQLMVGFTLPLITLGTVATKSFMDMETAALKFRKVYGDLFTPVEETNVALENIKELASSFTQYGIAVSDTVSLAAEAAAAGFQGLDLQRQTTEATRLQVLGQIDQQKALETTISLQNAFQMQSADLADSINFLNAVENQTVVSLDDITTAIPKAAPVVRQLGGDVKDLAFFMAAMKEGGINASEGANALKSGLASLINPTNKAKEMMAGFGIDIDSIVNKNAGNVKATVIEFAKALDGLSNLNRQRAIEQLFGKFQLARLSTLFENVTKTGNQASRVLDLATASTEDLAAMANKELGMTADSAMNKFRKSVEDLKVALVPVGEVFLQVVTPFIEKIGNLLDKFNELSPTTKKVLTTLTVAIGAVAPVLLMTIGLFANFVANGIKGLNILRNGYLRLTGQSQILGEQTQYLTTEQREALAAAHSLEQSHARLTQTFTVESSALQALRKEYDLGFAAATRFASVNPGMMAPRGRKKFAKGVVSVPGPKGAGDIIPAMVSPGEAIIPAKMAKKYSGLISGMISGNIPGYATGLDPKQISNAAGYVFAHGQAPTIMTSQQISSLISAVTSQSQKMALQQATRMKGLTNFGFIAPEALNMGKMSGVESSAYFRSQGEMATSKIFDSIVQFIPSAANDPSVKSDMNLFAQNIADELSKAGTRAVSEPEFYKSVQTALSKTLTQATSSAFAPGMQKTMGQITTVSAYGGLANREERGQRYAISRPAQQAAFGYEAGATSYKSKSLISTVKKFSSKLSTTAINAIKTTQRSNSDSIVAKGLGEDFSSGYASGIVSGENKIRNAGGNLANAAISGTQSGRQRRVSTRPQGAPPSLPPTGPMLGPNRPTRYDRTAGRVAGRVRNVGGRVSDRYAGRGRGVAMAGSTALLAASFLPGKLGELAGKASMASFALSALSFLPGPLKLVTVGLVAAYGIIKLTNDAREKELKKLEAFGTAATNTKDQLEGLGNYFGVAPTKSPLQTTQITPFRVPAERAAIEQFKQSEEFKQFKDTIPALNKMKKGEAASSMRLRGFGLLAQGYSAQQVDLIINSILSESNKSSIKLNFKSIELTDESLSKFGEDLAKGLDSKELLDRIDKALKYGKKRFKGSKFENNFQAMIDAGMGEKSKKMLDETGKTISGYLDSISSGFQNGVINSKQFGLMTNGALKSISKYAPDAETQMVLLNSAIANMESPLAKAAAKIGDMAAKTLLLKSAMLGVEGITDRMTATLQAGRPTGYGPEAAMGQAEYDRVVKTLKRLNKAKRKEILADLKAYNDAMNAGPVNGVDKNKTFFEKELDMLGKKRDALREVNDELNRQNEYQQKQMDLISKAAQAKISGNYLQAAMLGQQSIGLAGEYSRESQIRQLDKITNITESAKSAAEKRKRYSTADYRLKENVRSGNYGAIAPLAKTPNTGLNYPTGGMVYNITQNISGPGMEEVVAAVGKETERIIRKNNKSNKVAI